MQQAPLVPELHLYSLPQCTILLHCPGLQSLVLIFMDIWGPGLKLFSFRMGKDLECQAGVIFPSWLGLGGILSPPAPPAKPRALVLGQL